MENRPEHFKDISKFSTFIEKSTIFPFFDALESPATSGVIIRADQITKGYEAIYYYSTQADKQSAAIHEIYLKSMEKYFVDYVAPKLKDAKKAGSVAFIKVWGDSWKNAKRGMKGLQAIFSYLERYYLNGKNLPLLYRSGCDLYYKKVFDVFKKDLVSIIYNFISQKRGEDIPERELVDRAIAVFMELGVEVGKGLEFYNDEFFKEFMEQSKLFYQKTSSGWIKTETCPGYLKLAEKLFLIEEVFAKNALHPTSVTSLMDLCHYELLGRVAEELLLKPSGFHEMVSKSANEDLTRLYNLFSKSGHCIHLLADQFKIFISGLGLDIINKFKAGSESKESGGDPNLFIDEIVKHHETFKVILRNCFKKDHVLEKALKEAFEEFINKESYTSNHLAKYIHNALSKDSKLQQKELNETIENVVMIYGYLRSKDMFEEKYQYYLAKRLLNNMSESEHSEKSTISKLKNEAGYTWTNKLETMFKDLVRSHELVDEFQKTTADGKLDYEFSAIVCTAGCWPQSISNSTKLPESLSTVTNLFYNFYMVRFPGTKLNWLSHKGEAEIIVRFSPQTTRLLVVSTYQMMIMLLFNESKVLKFSTIASALDSSKEELASHILSLAHPKVKILLKKPNVKELHEDDEFTINPKFVSKAYRMVVPLITIKQDEEDVNAALNNAVILQRRHQIDAAVVRIMKTRLRLDHNQLIAEVLKQLHRFRPEAADIKKRIEALIDLEYLARDEKDRKIYNYLA
jgi:hypothetical protein